MILGAIIWVITVRRSDIVDAVAKIAWAVLGAGLLSLLGWEVGQG